MRSEFDDMYNIDRESRERAKRQIGQNKLKRGQSASDFLAQSHGQAWFDRFEEHKPVPDTPSANPDVKFRSAKHTTTNEVWSLAETTIPASKEDVLAYLWDMDARCRWREGDQERRVVEHVSASEMVCHTRSLRPRGVREAVTRYTWFRPTATSIMLVGEETKHESCPDALLNKRRKSSFSRGSVSRGSTSSTGNGAVREALSVAVNIDESAPGHCHVKHVFAIRDGGNILGNITDLPKSEQTLALQAKVSRASAN
jgi:hypothetical protein